MALKGEFKRIWGRYAAEMRTAIKDKTFRTGVSRATKSYEEGITPLLERFKESSTLAEEVRRIKEKAIENIEDLIKMAERSFTEKGIKVYLAKDADEAKQIIGKIVGSGKIIVKSKSITTEEIHLREYLIEQGNEVWETDLGEFIIQIAKERPMHLVTPAMHVPRERVARLLKELFKRSYDPNDIPELVKAVSDFLREKYFTADVGIIGANAIAAKDGCVVLIHNEGNIRMVTCIPNKLIIVAGIEKIVPTLEDAFKVVYITARYAEYKVAGYFDVIAGPKTISLPSGERVSSVGPSEIHLILLDNGRSRMINDPLFKEAAYCLRCGACMYSCPVFKITAGKFGGPVYMGGIGVIWTYFVHGPEYAIPGAYSCLIDGRCYERCPMKIDTPKMIKELRARYASGEAFRG